MNEHVQFEQLAAYLDDALPRTERRAVESHLAACRQCRELAVAVADTRPQPRRRKPSLELPTWPTPAPRAALAGALALIVAIPLLVLILPSWTPSGARAPGLLGVQAGTLAQLSNTTAAAVRASAEGNWPPAPEFPAFTTGSSKPALRSASPGPAPVAVAPRHATVQDPRPGFAWIAPDAVAVEYYELLIVDANENLVLRQRLQATGTPGGLLRSAYPGGAPGLVRGAHYAWKINAHASGRTLASAYVPMRVLGTGESRRLQGHLEQAGAGFTEAVVLARAGLQGPAIDRLAQLTDRNIDRSRLRDVMRALLARHQVPATVRGRVLDGWIVAPARPASGPSEVPALERDGEAG